MTASAFDLRLELANELLDRGSVARSLGQHDDEHARFHERGPERLVGPLGLGLAHVRRPCAPVPPGATLRQAIALRGARK